MQAKSRLLLLSSSRTPGRGYLEHAREPIRAFLGPGVRRLLFIPYASVGRSYQEMTGRVREALEGLGYEVIGLHDAPDPVGALRAAEAVAVSGGNTFRLLHELYRRNLLDVLRDRVRAGLPYLGISAGSNVACPTMQTTNDM
ncbi:MAG TPA: dipeptidase PepE, partial [Gammaproteobacteria bacterium]